jgi:hypothetical protein
MAITEAGGDFVINDEFEITRDERGMWSGTQTFFIRKARLLELMPAARSAHPSFGWMYLGDAVCRGESGGWVKVDGKYAGVGVVGAEDEEEVVNPPRYTLNTSLSEEPLETHPRYVDNLTVEEIQVASKLAKDPPVDENKEPIAVDTSDWPAEAVELYDLLRRGVESYRDPKVTWTKSWVSTSQPGSLNDVGEIDTPEGSPPSVAAGRNWMNMGLNSSETAGIYENEITWELSGRGGYLAVLYS